MQKLKVALTHDVDRVCKTHQYFTRIMLSLRRGDIRGISRELEGYSNRKELYWNFPDIMKTEDELGVRSTFFFLQESYPFRLTHPSTWKLALGRYDIREESVASIIRLLDEEGWEIGLHGSYESYRDSILLENEKVQLEQVLGHPVTGIRQHYLNLSGRTWLLQKEAGFQYDSSLGFTNRIGYKDVLVTPFNPLNDEFIVFPLAVMDSCFVEDPDKDSNLQKVIEQTIEKNGVLVLNWHSNSWDDREYPGYKDEYVRIVRLLLGAGAVFKTLGEFYHDYYDDLIIR